MIRLKINAGKVLNNIDKRVIPSKYVPKKIAELVKDYPEDMQTDFRNFLDLSGNTTIDPNTIELDEQSGCLILTSKTREGFQYTTDELIQIVQEWLEGSFDYGSSDTITAGTLMLNFEAAYKEAMDGNAGKYHKILDTLAVVLETSSAELEQIMVEELTQNHGYSTGNCLQAFDPLDLNVAYIRLRETLGNSKANL
jgi:hypothetical protein